ncbi:MAG: NADH-quinone oxidoreductase subunit A, partial [Chloroflexi bacterium]|nr:NADH-quinone oxidoreductase subunit A [Chloroflexota bacterium]
MELYGRIALLLILAIIFVLLPLVVQRIVALRKPDPIKLATYECGVETVGPTWIQFRTHYYLYALAFVIFDVEAVFLLPWAVVYNQLGIVALVQMFIFLVILV